MPLILRRLATLPSLEAGLVVCDRAGSLLFRKPTAGFSIPRFGSACPLWPLFSVLGQPGQVVRSLHAQSERGDNRFDCIAVAEVVGKPSYNMVPLVQSSMLILPVPGGTTEKPPLLVGASCRVCPRGHCPARREPSILSEGF